MWYTKVVNMRDPLDCTCVICTPWREALDAERTKHEKEVSSLQEIISDLKQKIEAKPSGIVYEQLPFFEDSVEYKNELDEKGIFWRYGDLG